MPTCNLSETILNIWFHEFGKRGACLYVATSDDYMQAFKQSTLYSAFLRSGRSRISSTKDELQLCKVNRYGDPLQMATIV
jgi:hypothetical protein